MDTFLLQTVDGRPAFDFQLTLIDAIEHQRIMSIRPWAEYFDFEFIDADTPIEAMEPGGRIPIGGVGFCIDYMDYYYHVDYKPIALPSELMNRGRDFYSREICVVTDDDIKELQRIGSKESFFLKYIEKPKVLSQVFQNANAIFGELPKGRYIMSEEINIGAEWRAFVYKHKLVGLHPYGGDFTLFPDVDLIEDIIAEYASSPVVYTLDIGVAGDWDNTFIIEVDDFMSCGLAGFCDKKILPQMYRDWWKEYVSQK